MNLLGARPHYGLLTRLDRANRIAYWRPDSSSDEEQASYDGRPDRHPWPFARIQVDASSPLPHCIEPMGTRETLVRDHFNRVSTLAGASPGVGDTGWDLSANASLEPAGIGRGTMSLRTDAGVGVEAILRKTVDAISIAGREMLHVHARFQVDSVAGFGPIALVGLWTNTAGMMGATIIGANANVHYLGATAIEGLEVAANTFYDTDFVAIPEVLVAASFDGSVPAVSTAFFASLGVTTVRPVVYVTDNELAGTTRYRNRVDLYDLGVCPTPVVPEDLLP